LAAVITSTQHGALALPANRLMWPPVYQRLAGTAWPVLVMRQPWRNATTI